MDCQLIRIQTLDDIISGSYIVGIGMLSPLCPSNVTVKDSNMCSKMEMWHNLIALFVLISGFLVMLLCGVRQCYFSWKVKQRQREQRGSVGVSASYDRRVDTVSGECQDCCEVAFDQHCHQECCVDDRTCGGNREGDRRCGGKRDVNRSKVKRMSNIQTKIVKMKSKR